MGLERLQAVGAPVGPRGLLRVGVIIIIIIKINISIIIIIIVIIN